MYNLSGQEPSESFVIQAAVKPPLRPPTLPAHLPCLAHLLFVVLRASRLPLDLMKHILLIACTRTEKSNLSLESDLVLLTCLLSIIVFIYNYLLAFS